MSLKEQLKNQDAQYVDRKAEEQDLNIEQEHLRKKLAKIQKMHQDLQKQILSEKKKKGNEAKDLA